MNPSVHAWRDPVYLGYLSFAAGLLVFSGIVIAIVARVSGRNLTPVWRTWRSWLVMVPLFFALVAAGRIPFIIGMTLLAASGFKEYARATGLYRDWRMTGCVYSGIGVVGLTTMISHPEGNEHGWYGMFMAVPVYMVALIILVPIATNRTRGQLQTLALSIMGFIYIGWMFGHLAYLANSPRGCGYLLYLVVAVELNDVAAFTCGRLLGKHKLRDRVSPGKTIEGAVGALVFSMILPWVLWFSFPHFGALQLILTGLIVGVGGQLGDLAISVIKRDIGVKDMGNVIPGHGGILDRIDSLIYTAPLFMHMVDYFYEQFR